MNTEYILKIARVIAQKPHAGRGDEDGFTMIHYSHSCGSPACIAGHVIYDQGYEWREANGIETEIVARAFDIPYSQAVNITLGYDDDSNNSFRLRDISPQAAKICLVELTRTGKVSWTRAMELASDLSNSAIEETLA